MKVGDLVKYNYGPARGSGKDFWGAVRGELGVIIEIGCGGDPDVAEVLWFNNYGMQKSYTKYLEIISEVEIK